MPPGLTPDDRPEQVGLPRLTPTEDLILDLLVARRRLGWQVCQIPSVNRKALRSLAEQGLIGHDHGNVDRHDKAWLTPAGLVYAMSPTLQPPALGPECRAFYFGVRAALRVDCIRRNHHQGKHRGHTYQATDPAKGDVTVSKVLIKWTDAEGYGYDSVEYGDRMRTNDTEFAAAITRARERFGVTPPALADNPTF